MKRNVEEVACNGVDWRAVKRQVLEKIDHNTRCQAKDNLDYLRDHNQHFRNFFTARLTRDPEGVIGIHEVFVAYNDHLSRRSPSIGIPPHLSDIIEDFVKQLLDRWCGRASCGQWIGWKVMYPMFGFDSVKIRKDTQKPMSLVWDEAIDQLRIVDQDECGVMNSNYNIEIPLPNDDSFCVQMTRIIVINDAKTFVWRASAFTSKKDFTGIATDSNKRHAQRKCLANFMAKYESRTSRKERIRFSSHIQTTMKMQMTVLHAFWSDCVRKIENPMAIIRKQYLHDRFTLWYDRNAKYHDTPIPTCQTLYNYAHQRAEWNPIELHWKSHIIID